MVLFVKILLILAVSALLIYNLFKLIVDFRSIKKKKSEKKAIDSSKNLKL